MGRACTCHTGSRSNKREIREVTIMIVSPTKRGIGGGELMPKNGQKDMLLYLFLFPWLAYLLIYLQYIPTLTAEFAFI
jgi:hypothetical protein